MFPSVDGNKTNLHTEKTPSRHASTSLKSPGSTESRELFLFPMNQLGHIPSSKESSMGMSFLSWCCRNPGHPKADLWSKQAVSQQCPHVTWPATSLSSLWKTRPREWSGHLHCYLPFRSFHGAPEVKAQSNHGAFQKSRFPRFPASSVMVSPNSLETLLRFLRLILLQAFIRLQLSKTTPIRQNQLTPPQPRHSQDSPCFVIIKQVENLVDAIPRLFVALSKNFKVGGIYHLQEWGNKGWWQGHD